MNDRIKQLRDQAWKEVYDVDPADLRIARAHAVTEAGMQKFAELILRECVKITRPDIAYPHEGNDWEQGFYTGKEDAADYIKEYFGVPK